MRAVRLGEGLHYEPSLAMPTCKDGEALIQVSCAGICNTDLELVEGYLNFKGTLGHEFAGTVVDGPADWLNQRVAGEINVADGTCDMCARGIPSQCRNRKALGLRGHDGAFADYMVLPVVNLHRVPDSVPDRAAVFTEPLAACLQILEAVHISPRHHIVVVGAGKMGLLAAQVLRLTGADVSVLARRERPRALLERWGIPALNREEIADKSVPIVVDCTGTPDGFAESLRIVEPRGTIVLKSTYHGLPQADLSRVVVDEVRVVGSRCGPFDAALRLLARGLIDTENMIDAVYPIGEALTAFERASQPGALKVLLQLG